MLVGIRVGVVKNRDFVGRLLLTHGVPYIAQSGGFYAANVNNDLTRCVCPASTGILVASGKTDVPW